VNDSQIFIAFQESPTARRRRAARWCSTPASSGVVLRAVLFVEAVMAVAPCSAPPA
jgi:hypothetical protein